eukprot:scaffold2514_cov373-Prasinococcus_capsulatus_cf.AAC.13
MRASPLCAFRWHGCSPNAAALRQPHRQDAELRDSWGAGCLLLGRHARRRTTPVPVPCSSSGPADVTAQARPATNAQHETGARRLCERPPFHPTAVTRRCRRGAFEGGLGRVIVFLATRKPPAEDAGARGGGRARSRMRSPSPHAAAAAAAAAAGAARCCSDDGMVLLIVRVSRERTARDRLLNQSSIIILVSHRGCSGDHAPSAPGRPSGRSGPAGRVGGEGGSRGGARAPPRGPRGRRRGSSRTCGGGGGCARPGAGKAIAETAGPVWASRLVAIRFVSIIIVYMEYY